MKKLIFLFIMLTTLVGRQMEAQKITITDLRQLRVKEDSLLQIAEYMIADSVSAGRLLAYKDFVPVFLRTLKIKNSFYYPFDSLLGISKLYAPDSSFRLFTWFVQVDDYTGFQRGFLQHRTKDGTLKGHVLFDNSDYTDDPSNVVCMDSTWIGAVYYNIIKTDYKGKNYYTLFGIDRNAVRSTRKWIEVLSFNNRNEPIFGGPFFSFEEDSLVKPVAHRFGIEFKKEARTLVNYIPEMEMILVDHLVSETDEPDFPWTFVPDGDYEGFKWQNGKWVHVDKVFTFKLEDGQAPVENPIIDPAGKKDDKKLEQKSETNKTKKSGGGD